MKNNMKLQLAAFLKIYLPFSIILFAIQYSVVNFSLETELYYSTLSIYAFHFIATFLVYALVLLVHQNFKNQSGFAFMGLGLFKMIGALVFLLPLLLGEMGNKFTELMAFFIPYFIFLMFETIYVVKIINQK